jgi:hypothetical protein
MEGLTEQSKYYSTGIVLPHKCIALVMAIGRVDLAGTLLITTLAL